MTSDREEININNIYCYLFCYCYSQYLLFVQFIQLIVQFVQSPNPSKRQSQEWGGDCQTSKPHSQLAHFTT